DVGAMSSREFLKWLIEDTSLEEPKKTELRELLVASQHRTPARLEVHIQEILWGPIQDYGDHVKSVVGILKSAGFTLEQLLNLKNNQYDLVINGIEIAGGSIRMHRTDWQRDVFELIGISAEEAENKFGFLLSALAHGAP